jgi:hypothetical protein
MMKIWLAVGLGTMLLGLFIFVLGAEPEIFNLDRSPAIGFVQTAVFSIGLAMICLGGYISFRVTRGEDYQATLTEDIGLRLVGTGYLIAFIAAMADVFGLGTQFFPDVPFFGPAQAVGVVVGEIIIAIGFLMYVPRQNGSQTGGE